MSSRIPPRLSHEELSLELLKLGYDIPVIALKLRTRDERAHAEHWAAYVLRADRAHGYAHARPIWLEKWVKV